MSQLFAKQWRKVIEATSEVDLTFLILRILSLFGCLIWLNLVPLTPQERYILLSALAGFVVYSSICYLVIFLQPRRLRTIYLVSLFLDLIFLSYLVSSQLHLENSFFIGFYLLVCLHTIYFGLRFGLLVATLAGILYTACIYNHLPHLNWAEIAIRIIFLYLLALPVGLLSNKVHRDKKTVEQLNNDLAKSLQDLRSMQEKLIEAEKLSALGRLTAYIAHEIRNPLTAVGGFARRLDSKFAEGSPEKEYISIINHEVMRLEKILMDTLVYGKISDVKLVRYDLNEPVSTAVALYRELCNEHNIALTEDLSPDLPWGLINAEHVQQALDSLLSNSIQAMPDGGNLAIRTGQETKNNASYLTINIQDTGQGIDPELIEFIFEPFYSTKKIGTGTGLGLPIVKKIIDEHRGLIEVKNYPGQQTDFKLFFPYQNYDDDQKTPCWEFMQCGIETDPSNRCSAYPYFGRICWATAGTYSEAGIHGICAQKIDNCQQCSFYKMVNQFLPHYSER